MGALHQDLKHVTATDCHPLHGTQYVTQKQEALRDRR